MTKPDRILLASGNRKKLAELTDILRPHGIPVVGPEDVGYVPDVDETGTTFAANAVLKSEAGCLATGLWTLADDSGIEARALGWRPGVYSARYAGEPCDDEANNRKLVEELKGLADRFVQYRCVISLSRPGQLPLLWDGTFAGEHVPTPRGAGGFGYDPYVLLPELGRTVAQITPAEKHARSHRGQALRGFTTWLATLSVALVVLPGCGDDPPPAPAPATDAREEQLRPLQAVEAVGYDGKALQDATRRMLETHDAQQKKLQEAVGE